MLAANGLDVPATRDWADSCHGWAISAAGRAGVVAGVVIHTPSASGIPVSAVAQALTVPDCMAAQGWLIVVMSGSPADMTGCNTAVQKCGPLSSGGPTVISRAKSRRWL